MRSGIKIAPSTSISKSAIIQPDTDSGSLGGRVLISERATISDGVIIAAWGGSIKIEPNVYIGPYCILYGHGGLTIGCNTMVAAHTVIVPANHGFSRIDIPMNAQPLTREGIEIGEDVWIGAGCKILDGVRIGKGAVIGAGSVVTKNVDSYGIAVGVPATVVRSRRARPKG